MAFAYTQWTRGLCAATVLTIGCGDDTTGASGEEDGSSSTAGTDADSGSTAATTTADGTGSTTNTQTTAADTTVGDSSSSGSDDSGSEDSGTDTGTNAEDCYEPENFPYAGALCGPDANPCSVLAVEAVDDTPYFRNDAPAIVLDNGCDPQVMYSVAVGGFFGHLARRTGIDTWEDNPTPFDVAVPGLGFDAATGDTLTVSDNGSFGVNVWRWDGAWTMEDTLPGDNHFNMRAGAHNGDGTLHLAPTTSGADLQYTHYDGGWNTQAVAVQSSRATIALGPSATPHIGFWTSEFGAWEMWWAIPGQASELVEPLGGGVLNRSNERISVTDDGGDGTPHLLFATASAPGGLNEVVYATRIGPAAWTVSPIVTENEAFNEQCDYMPFASGEQCDFEYFRARPLDLITSDGGDVRMLISMDAYMGTLEASCMPGPGGEFCTWNTIADTSEFEVLLAWPDGLGFDSTVLFSGTYIQTMDSAVDRDGTIHIAAHVGRSEPRVEYLQIGARD